MGRNRDRNLHILQVSLPTLFANATATQRGGGNCRILQYIRSDTIAEVKHAKFYSVITDKGTDTVKSSLSLRLSSVFFFIL